MADKKESISLLEFIKKYLVFTPTHTQELFMTYLENSKQINVIPSYQAQKEYINNEFACRKLTSMKPEDIFILATPAGVFKFKLESIEHFDTELAGTKANKVFIDDLKEESK